MDIAEDFRIAVQPHIPFVLIKIRIAAMSTHTAGVGEVLNHVAGTLA